MEIQLNPESIIQVQSVTVTLSGHGKSVTAADCHSNCLPLPASRYFAKTAYYGQKISQMARYGPGVFEVIIWPRSEDIYGN